MVICPKIYPVSTPTGAAEYLAVKIKKIINTNDYTNIFCQISHISKPKTFVKQLIKNVFYFYISFTKNKKLFFKGVKPFSNSIIVHVSTAFAMNAIVSLQLQITSTWLPRLSYCQPWQINTRRNQPWK